MKAIIVEDSRLARLELKKLLESFRQVEVVAESGDPDEGIQLIHAHKPELLFLDIQMPGKNGFELLDALDYQPAVIFTTAFDQYAVRSFEYDAVDYLLKPIEKHRLAQALGKVSSQADSGEQDLVPLALDSSVFVKDGERCWMVALNDISHIESCGNYSKIFFEQHGPLIHKSLNQLEERLPDELFFRINRQQIINLKHIQSVSPWFNGALKITLKNAQEVEVSRRHSSRFKTRLSL